MNTPLHFSSTSIAVRPATLADIEQLTSLFDEYRRFYEQPPDVAQAKQYLHDRITNRESVVLLANAVAVPGQTIGFCQLYPTFCSVEMAPIYALYDLFVIPAARRAGVGRALLQAAEQHALDSGKVRLELRTARSNLPAQATYESLSWVQDGRFLCYSKRAAASDPPSTAS
jgi:GNAT superfamily N-acetyltransferase